MVWTVSVSVCISSVWCIGSGGLVHPHQPPLPVFAAAGAARVHSDTSEGAGRQPVRDVVLL